MSEFEFLVLSLRADIEMQLGLYAQGEEKPEPQLPLARKLIDTLAMLQEKTKGNLTLEEQRMLDNCVTELRFRYMQAFEENKKKSETTTEKVAEAGANE